MSGRILASSILRRSIQTSQSILNITPKLDITSVVFYKQNQQCFYPFNNPFNNDTQIRHAGHSKWANIKHTKGLKDQEKSSQRTKIAQMIRVAVKEGGGIMDPKINSKLADAIEYAKGIKVPNEVLQRLLSAKVKDTKPAAFAVKCGSTVIIAEVETNNTTKTRQDLTSIVKKKNFTVSEVSSVSYMFKQVGIIRCSEYKGAPATETHLDEAITHALESGADDVQVIESDDNDGKVYEFLTDPDPRTFFPVQDALTKLGYKIDYSEVDYVPDSRVSLNDEELELVSKICEKLLANEEVTRLHDNIA